MGVGLDDGALRVAPRVATLLERVEHRCVVEGADRDAVYRLRYEVYLRRNLLTARLERKLYDEVYDNDPNAFTTMTFIDGELASTLRVHILVDGHAISPAFEVFPDVLSPILKAHLTIVDPTRLAASAEMSRRYPELPYFALRPAWMAADYFEADFVVVSASPGHEAFYRRVVGYDSWSGLRDYPGVTAKVLCMGLDFPKAKLKVEERYPSFRSTVCERERLFGSKPILRNVSAWQATANRPSGEASVMIPAA